jgi:SAM-dependent methyltransferase
VAVGIVLSFAQFLQRSAVDHGPFGQTLTLGRQSSMLRLRDLPALKIARPAANPAAYCAPAPAEALLRDAFGATEVHAMDASAYEEADLVHDLNTPVAPDHFGRFDTIIDGGTLEHVFNVPVALDSLMRMLRVGGRMFLASPANNHCGHGFYQFSPELWYRVFSQERGFSVRRLELFEHAFPGIELSSDGRSFEVVDPAVAGRRVQLVTSRSVMAYVEATKIAGIAGALPTPQQSDYVDRWTAAGGPVSGSAPRSTGMSLKTALVRAFDRWAWGRGTYQRVFEASFRNRRLYRRRR